MQMNFDMDNETGRVINIKVVGVGGGGGNAVNHMVVSEVQGVEFISLNTDRQALMKSKATVKTVIGEKTCKGGGAGGNPDVGQRAGEESRDEIMAALKGAQMVFVTAGMSGTFTSTLSLIFSTAWRCAFSKSPAKTPVILKSWSKVTLTMKSTPASLATARLSS